MEPLEKLQEQIEQCAPWPETERALWSESPELAARRGRPTRSESRARRGLRDLVRAFRRSEGKILANLAVTDLVASESDSSRSKVTAVWLEDDAARRTLRTPRATARLFLDDTVRAGKDVYSFSQKLLSELPHDDAELARLLRLLAVAADTPKSERSALVPEWSSIDPTADLGVVLTPMAWRARTVGEQPIIGDDALANDLASRLHAFPEELGSWLAAFLREGGARLRELFATTDRSFQE